MIQNTNSDFMLIIAFAVSEQQQHIWQAELCWKNTTMEPRIKLALTKQKPAFFPQKQPLQSLLANLDLASLK